MPIDPAVAVGAQLPDRPFSWTESDVLLYHLGIGAGSATGANLDLKALRFTLDGPDLQVLPSFGIVAPGFHETRPPSLDMPGCQLDLANVVHGSQEITVAAPLPTSGSGVLRTRISDVWDKGKAAVVVQEAEAVAADGTVLFTTRSSIFARGEGGFGGDRGPSTSVELPTRTADLDTTYDVTPQQALLYRLCGDRNPLHADPAFAAGAGFPAPILHGLCSYGIVLRTVTEGLLDSDATLVSGFAARFAGVVFPGETIRVRAFDERAGGAGQATSGQATSGQATSGRIIVEATIASTNPQRDGAPVLADCVLTV